MTPKRAGISRGKRLLTLILFVACTVVAAPGGDFSLTDHNGESFRLQQLRGKLVLLFFGYTHCPDICPTELANLAAVMNTLGDRAAEVQGVFVSLDPERDTPALLRDYTRYFSDNLIGLTGSQEEIAAVARQYRVKYNKHWKENGGYSLDHSVNLYVIDRNGLLSTIVPYGLPPEHVLMLIRRLLQGE